MNLKNQLRGLLADRGMTAAELSRKSGVSKQVISLWLGGAKPKNVEQVKKVADCFDVSIDFLLFGKSENRKETISAGLESLMGNEWVGGTFEIKIRRVRRSETK